MSADRDPAWRRYITFWRRNVDRDVDAEIRFHFDERVSDLEAGGLAPAQARAQAAEEFGDRELYRNRLREIDQRVETHRARGEWIADVLSDVRFALRGMRRTPGLTATIVVTLALGIGANGAIFSMLDRIFLRAPDGVLAPHELRRLYGEFTPPPPSPKQTRRVFGYEEYRGIGDALGERQPMVAYRTQLTRLGVADDAPMAQVADVLGDYFGMLGVRTALGRSFAPEERDPSTPHQIAVLSYRFWTHQFASDSGVVGRTIQIGRSPVTVIGVAQPDFDGLDLDAVDVWRPAFSRSPGFGPGTASLRIVMRMHDGVSEVATAQTAGNGLPIGDGFARTTRMFLGSIIAAQAPGDRNKEPAIALRLAGVTLIVLLIAVANVANLLLTRAIERRRELSIRVAIGSSRARLAGQLVTESAVLALIAGGVALVIATWGAALVRHLLLPDVRWAGPPLDVRLAVYTVAIALGAGLLTGLLPFVRMGRLDLSSEMRGGARDGGAHRSKLRTTLIVVQAGLSVVLLTGAALFVRSLQAVRTLDLGYDTDGVITVGVASGQRIIPSAESDAGLREIRDRTAALPGVRAVALSNLAPMAGLSFTELHFPGRDSLPRTSTGGPTFVAVGPDYFRAVGARMRLGRAFTEGDANGSAPVMIVTRTMARVVWGSANPLGQCVHVGPTTSPCTTVVGVIDDVRRGQVVEDETLQFFLPLAQAPKFATGAGSVVVGADVRQVPAVRAEIRAIVLQVFPGGRPVISTLAEKLDPQYRPWRVGASLFSAFGLLALLVAAIGVYSAISYGVTQRQHELGVRLALGAQRSEIGRLVIGGGVRLVLYGAVAGVLASLALSRLIESLLYQTNPRDPVVLIVVSAVLLLVAVFASATPAWRASRLDPVRALRAE